MPEHVPKEQEARRRHAVYYLNILRVRNFSLDKPIPSQVFDEEWANVSQAQAWAASTFAENKAAAKLCIEFADYGVNWLLSNHMLEEAIRWCESALAAAKRFGSPQNLGTNYLQLGTVYSFVEDQEKAVEYYKQCLALVRAHSARETEGLLLIKLGDACARQRLDESAISYYEEALRIAAETQNKDLELSALVSQGDAFARHEYHARAHSFYEAALAKLREVPGAARFHDVWRTEGMLYLSLGRYDEAIKCFEEALRSFEVDSFVKFGILSSLGGAYFGAGDFNRAVDAYSRLLSLARELELEALEADTLGRLAQVFLGSGDMTRALASYQQALKLYEVLGADYYRADTLRMMGDIFARLSLLEQMADCYGNALRLIDGESELAVDVKLSLAMSAEHASHRRQAKALVEEELERTAGMPDSLRRAKALLGMASLCARGGDGRQAIALAEECLDKARAHGYHLLELSALRVLTSVYSGRKDFSAAERTGLQALAVLKNRAELMIERQHFLRGLWVNYLQSKDYLKALDCAQQRLDNARLVGNRKEEGEALIEIGAVKQCQGDEARARRLISEGFSALKQHGSQSDLAMGHFVVGGVYQINNEIERAISSYEEAARLGEEAGDSRSAHWAWSTLSSIYGGLEDPGRKKRFYESLLNFSQRSQSPDLAALAHSGLAIYFCSSQRYEEALVQYQQSLESAREAGERAWEQKSLGFVGLTLETLAHGKSLEESEPRARVTSAAEHYERQFEIAAELEDLEGKLAALGGLGRTHAALGNLSQAVSFLEQRLSLARAARHAEVAMTANMLSQIYVQGGRQEEAIAMYDSLLAESTADGDIRSESLHLTSLAIIHAQSGQPQHALRLAELAAELAAKASDPGNEGMAMYIKAQVLNYKLDRHEEAASLASAALEKLKEAGAQAFVIDTFRDEMSRWPTR